MKYYSIRVIEADNLEEAWNQVEEGNFEEWDDMCDEVYTLEELNEKVKQQQQLNNE